MSVEPISIEAGTGPLWPDRVEGGGNLRIDADRRELQLELDGLVDAVDELWGLVSGLAVLSGALAVVATVAKMRALVKEYRREIESAKDGMDGLKWRLEDDLRYLKDLLDRLLREIVADARDSAVEKLGEKILESGEEPKEKGETTWVA